MVQKKKFVFFLLAMGMGLRLGWDGARHGAGYGAGYGLRMQLGIEVWAGEGAGDGTEEKLRSGDEAENLR